MSRKPKLKSYLAACFVVIASMTACSYISPTEEPTVQTPLAKRMDELQKLKTAEDQDYTKAMKNEESNRKLGNYYARKGSQAHRLIDEMEDGHQVNESEVSQALDDSDSVNFYERPPFNPFERE
jgi:Txe/YoeB family toxin of Txe-Axe toxin-antitoxin module